MTIFSTIKQSTLKMKAAQIELSYPIPTVNVGANRSILATNLIVTVMGENMRLCPTNKVGPILSNVITIPIKDAGKLVDAIDDVAGCVTDFAEALADIAYEAGAAGFRLADSRATIPLFIQWAKEFCQINVGREWDGEYLEEIQAFTEAKMAPEIPDDDFIAKF